MCTEQKCFYLKKRGWGRKKLVFALRCSLFEIYLRSLIFHVVSKSLSTHWCQKSKAQRFFWNEGTEICYFEKLSIERIAFKQPGKHWVCGAIFD